PWKIEAVLLGLDQLRRLSVDLAHGVDEVDRVELVAAVVALVAARARVPADGARTFYIAIGQRPSGGRADRAELDFRKDVPVLEQAEEQLLRRRVMVLGRGAGEQVVAQAQLLQVA